jgi:hypothetical protein
MKVPEIKFYYEKIIELIRKEISRGFAFLIGSQVNLLLWEPNFKEPRL